MRANRIGTFALGASLVAVVGFGTASFAEVGFAAAARAVDASEDKAPDAKAAFERMKSTLPGEWGGTIEGNEGGSGEVSFRITAAGTVLEETLLPGTPQEMVSMYHMEGDSLVLVHYCAAGNQPKMKYDPATSSKDEYHFAFAGGTNFDPAKDMHIHELHLRFLDGGKVQAEWIHWEGGKRGGELKVTYSKKS